MSELLSPVGNMEMALAAIHNGADAIYVGFPHFNARGRSEDFDTKALREIIETCHLYGVRAHLALNILIFPGEIESVIRALEEILPLKPDALIVQDLGLAMLLRRMAPEQVIHASTQMTVTNDEAIRLVEDLNIRRFVLGRENSIAEIKAIKASVPDKDLEVFVHGALCVSYSGQCFTSEAIGGRSANRGQCAQSCRFGYEMIVDGMPMGKVDKKYIVSPSDLCGLAEVGELMDIGVSSFKIEGRLKSPEYVAAATREYRGAIDRHLLGHATKIAGLAASQRRLSTTYSRGFFPGWLHGVNHQRLVQGNVKAHRGLEIGKVETFNDSSMTVKLSEPVTLSAGDGLLWIGHDSSESGTQVYGVEKLGSNKVRVEFANGTELGPMSRGSRVFLNSVAAQKKDLRKSFQDREQLKRIDVSIVVDVRIGQPLRAEISDGRFKCSAEGRSFVEPAEKRAVDDAFIKSELGALGATAFKLNEFRVQRPDASPIFYPHRELKEIRRELCEKLEHARRQNRVWGDETPIATSGEMLAWANNQREPSATSAPKPRLNILLREMGQVFDLCEAVEAGRTVPDQIDAVILDFEFGRDLASSVAKLKAANLRCGIATNRILKPKEYVHFKLIEQLQPEVILIRNLGALYYFTKEKPYAGELRGDFSLNVANHLTAKYLLDKGLTTVTASYDLNARQLNDLLATADAARIEVTIHQYMPAFHMEHCVFASMLSKGSSFRDCGKPCEKHRVEMVDEFGNRHFIKADSECRNTMFNAVAQSAASQLGEWKAQHLGAVRFEALHERGDDLIAKIASYQSLISGDTTVSQILSELKVKENYGLGQGALGMKGEYRSVKKTDWRGARS